MRNVWWLLALLPGILPPGGGVWAQGTTYVVSGRVAQRGETAGIPAATLRLSERLLQVSGPDGGFRFANVREGVHVLTVEAMGYRSLELSLDVRSDTTLLVELEVDPIPLDSLLVEAELVSLRGIVSDAVTGRRIPEAWIRTGSLSEVYTARDGSFEINDLPRGYPVPVFVHAYRYRAHTETLVAHRDTTLNVALRPDALAVELFQRAGQQLEIRGRGANLPQVQVSRDFIERRIYHDISELIRATGSRVSEKCLFIDEVRQTFAEVLDTYQTSEIERIEIYGRGKMIRVYTQDFVAQNLARIEELPPVVYVTSGICF